MARRRQRATAQRPAGSGAGRPSPPPASGAAAGRAPDARTVARAVPLLRAVSHRDALTALALGVLAAAGYLPALSGGFVWDDVIFAEEPVIHAPAGLRSVWFSPADIRNEGHYWPLVYTSFWLEHKLWGLRLRRAITPSTWLLHVAQRACWCGACWRGSRVPGAAARSAAVFAVHPAARRVGGLDHRTQGPALGAVLSGRGAGRGCASSRRPWAGRYLRWRWGCSSPGMLSKPVVVTLPAALLIWHWWQQGKVTRIDLLRMAPFVAVAVAITVGDLSFYTSREPLELGYSLVERALIASRALWFYAGTLLWPADLAVIYPLWEIDAGDLGSWAYLVAAAALAAGCGWRARRIGRGPVGGGAVLRGDAGAGAGVRGLRLHAVLVRGRPVPVPGGDRRAGGADRGGGARRGKAAGGVPAGRAGSGRGRGRGRWSR